MEYRKIISITGMSGLFELLGSKADGAVVRSLEDKTSKFVSSRVHNFSNLETIEVLTTKDNLNLADVFIAMKEKGGTMPDAKADAKDLKAYFLTIVPDMDMERVYVSDMKKMLKWYEILNANNVEIKSPVIEDEVEEGGEVKEKKEIKKEEKTEIKMDRKKDTKPATAKHVKSASRIPQKKG